MSALVSHGHTVIVETDAGKGSGFSDKEYTDAGAVIYHSKPDMFREAELIVKVKEPLTEEYDLFRSGQTLYTYLHLAADRKLTEKLLEKKSHCHRL